MTDDRSEPVPVVDEAGMVARRYLAAKDDVDRIGHMQSTPETEVAYAEAKEELAMATAHLHKLVPALLALSARVEEWRPIGDELRERLKLKYAGDCRCGKCQLVPADLIHRILSAIPLPSPPIEKG